MAGEARANGNLVWMDLEMSELDVDKDVILEVATVVTNADLNVVAEGPCSMAWTSGTPSTTVPSGRQKDMA